MRRRNHCGHEAFASALNGESYSKVSWLNVAPITGHPPLGSKVLGHQSELPPRLELRESLSRDGKCHPETLTFRRSRFALGLGHTAFCILFHTKAPCSFKCTMQEILICGDKRYMSHSHAPPSTGNRNEYFRGFRYKFLLLFWSQHQVSIPMLLCSKSREYPTANTKIGRPHMGALFRAGETKRNSSEITHCHGRA